MLDLGYELTIIFNKVKLFFTPELLTSIVLLVMLFRKTILNLLLITSAQMFKIPKKNIIDTKTSYLKKYIIFAGIYLIILIWVKNLEFISNVTTLFKIITILVFAKTVVTVISPDSVFIETLKKNNKVNWDLELLSNTFIFTILKFFIYILAIFIIITDLGYNINGLAAGLGIGTAIIALAVQDLVKSFISGAAIITEKPFIIGDMIQVKEFAGTVENITLRNTVIRLRDNTLMSIPNSIITTEYLINIDKIQNRHVEFNLNFAMDTDMKKIENILSKAKKLLEKNTKVIKETIEVNFLEILETGIKVRIRCYLNEKKWKQYLHIKEELNFEIMKILNAEQTLPLYNNNLKLDTKEFKIQIERKHIKSGE